MKLLTKSKKNITLLVQQKSQNFFYIIFLVGNAIRFVVSKGREVNSISLQFRALGKNNNNI